MTGGMMNKSWLYILLFVFWGYAVAYGQDSPVNMRSRLVIPAEAMRFDSLLRLASRQTGIKFSLNTKKFEPSKIIRVKKGGQSVEELLLAIKSGTGIYYQLLGDHIIFVDSPPGKASKPSPPKSNRPSPPRPTTVIKNISPAAADSTRAYKTAHVSTARPSFSTMPISIIPGKARMATFKKSTWRNAPPQSSGAGGDAGGRQNISHTGKLFARAGLAVDETFYCNPSIQAGLPFLYGIVSWSTNFTLSGIRYGAGASVRLSDNWRLHVTATTGAMSRKYEGDTSRQGFRLHRGGLFIEKQCGERLQLGFGPLLNILTTTYYYRDAPSLLLMTDARIKNKQYLHPLYTFSDTWSSASASNTKIWVGLQASLFYTINF